MYLDAVGQALADDTSFEERLQCVGRILEDYCQRVGGHDDWLHVSVLLAARAALLALRRQIEGSHEGEPSWEQPWCLLQFPMALSDAGGGTATTTLQTVSSESDFASAESLGEFVAYLAKRALPYAAFYRLTNCVA